MATGLSRLTALLFVAEICNDDGFLKFGYALDSFEQVILSPDSVILSSTPASITPVSTVLLRLLKLRPLHRPPLHHPLLQFLLFHPRPRTQVHLRILPTYLAPPQAPTKQSLTPPTPPVPLHLPQPHPHKPTSIWTMISIPSLPLSSNLKGPVPISEQILLESDSLPLIPMPTQCQTLLSNFLVRMGCRTTASLHYRPHKT